MSAAEAAPEPVPEVSAWPRAVLWDLDGTLVDTEPYWMRAEAELVATHGGTWTHEDGLHVVGFDLRDSAAYVRDRGGVDLGIDEIVGLLLVRVEEQLRESVPWRPGARELLGRLRAEGVPCGLVTMSWRQMALAIVESLPSDTFDTVVAGDDVTRGKPHPEPYERALQGLGVEAEDALAIEDSPTGAASAEAAGCSVLVVPCHVSVPDGPRRRQRDSLEGLSPEDLAGLRVEA